MKEAIENTLWHSSEEVAARYGVPARSVADWRHRRIGPAFVRFGRHVRYSSDALAAYELDQARKSARA